MTLHKGGNVQSDGAAEKPAATPPEERPVREA